MAKKTAPSASLRKTLYWTKDMDSKVEQAAEILHKRGVKGIYNSDETVNRTAVIRHALAAIVDGKAG